MANALLMSALQCLLNLTVTICVNLSTYARIVALHSTCNSIAPFVFQRKKSLMNSVEHKRMQCRIPLSTQTAPRQYSAHVSIFTPPDS